MTVSNDPPEDFERPLAGLKVLELSQIMAGPVCGVLLSDMGADVIKVERFPGGDDARGYQRPGDPGLSPAFTMINRGKRSVALDIRTPEGREALLRLVAQVDVVTENFRVGTMERLGLGHEVLMQANPRLIYAAISGYGRVGPLAQQGGFDLILQAFSGLISVTGEEGRAGVKPGISVADVNAGILAALGVLAAYIRRLRTGRGGRVDTSLLQACLQQTYWFAAAYFSKGIVAKPMGTAHPLIAPYQTFACADGAIAIGGGNQANWLRIAATLGHSEWADDPRFTTGASRLGHRRELEALMTAVLCTNTVAHWTAALATAGVPVGPVQDVGQALSHPQTRAVGMVIDNPDPRTGLDKAVGCPVHFDGHSPTRTGPAPLVGEHTQQVLREFGFDEEALRRLAEAGAIPPPRHATEPA
ncbi:CaiB/BaiF CoA transferase family protein [Hydrogenophaga intermedia]|uniref:Acyl-CoA transferase/carnitine dehydratase n=1 Tax=Hydrogenophaga intermedia TaxID=65786 RepID=A0A1L1PSN4_HYDIT|nr:CoA transferase [Hydrogenophaga intermedia]TMU72335.1 CoA transferase [Hydrogenophaga intermedia]CDN89066.1 Acyl-CoA transferase/carnitine dehydratase [Hydrogenophaga intermedia]